MMAIQIPAANEVVSALLAKKYVADKALLTAVKNDPRKVLDMRETALQVRTVQNTAEVLNVCVPDYEAMSALKSDELENIAGGTLTPLATMVTALAATVSVCQAYQVATASAIAAIRG